MIQLSKMQNSKNGETHITCMLYVYVMCVIHRVKLACVSSSSPWSISLSSENLEATWEDNEFTI